jgi:transcriptional regulator with XRE-family HTH domain
MTTRSNVRSRGLETATDMLRSIGYELRSARVAAGLSQAAVARTAGVSREYLCRIELGRTQSVDLVTACVLFAVLGRRLSIKGYPLGDPLRDAGHHRLLDRFERRVPPTWRRQREAPMPGLQDLRAWDLLLTGPVSIGVEAETRLRDVQATERAMTLKRRDSGARRMALLLASTPHNEAVVRAHLASLRQTFPVDTRRFLAAIRDGVDPGADALVLL